MATGTPTTQPGVGSKIIGTLVVTALIVAGLAWVGSKTEEEPDGDDDSDRWGVVEMVVIWMDRVLDHERAWDPEWEDQPTRLVDPARDLTITYWVNDERHAVLYDDDQKGNWTETVSYPPGTEIELFAEELAGSGTGRTPFKMCMIHQWNRRNVGYEHHNDLDDCRVGITVQ